MVGRVHGGHRNCFFRIVEGHIQAVFGDIHIRHFLRTQANPRHCFHGFRRILASSGFCREHYCIGTIKYGVCHVHHFRTGRHWVSDHGFHHLGCCDHDTIQLTAATNQFFLDADQLRIADFHTEVTTGDHHHIGCENDFIHHLIGGDRFGAFDFGDNHCLTTGVTGETAGIVQIFRAAREGDSKVININTGCGFDIFFIFFCQRISR